MNDRRFSALRARLEFRRPAGWLCLAGTVLLACLPFFAQTGRAQQKGPAPPSWYSRPAANPQVLVARASAASKDKQLAIDKAVHDARVELGRMVQSRTDSIRRSAEREAALDAEGTQRYSQAGSRIATVLKGSRIRNQRQIRKGKVWTAFVVVEIPLGATSSALLSAVREDALLSSTLGPTQAFRALEAEVAAYQRRPGTSGKK